MKISIFALLLFLGAQVSALECVGPTPKPTANRRRMATDTYQPLWVRINVGAQSHTTVFEIKYEGGGWPPFYQEMGKIEQEFDRTGPGRRFIHLLGRQGNRVGTVELVREKAFCVFGGDRIRELTCQ